MLIKHQSFDISQRRKSENCNGSDSLYDAKKCPYLKYVLIPAVTGFVLLCILINVDFSNGNNKHLNKTHVKGEMKNVLNASNRENIAESFKSENLNDKEIFTQKQFKKMLIENSDNIESKLKLPHALKDKKSGIPSIISSSEIGNFASFQIDNFDMSTNLDKENKLRDTFAKTLNDNFSSVLRKYFAPNYAQTKVGKDLPSNLVKDYKLKDALIPKMNFKTQKTVCPESNLKNLTNYNKPNTTYKIEVLFIKFNVTKLTSSSLSNDVRGFQKSFTTSSAPQKLFNKSIATKIVGVTRNTQNINTKQFFTIQGKQVNQTSRMAESRPNKLLSPPTSHPMIHQQLGQKIERLKREAVPAIKCTRYIETYSLICDTGGLSHIDVDLEDFQGSCGKESIKLELNNCIFPDGIMKNNIFKGFFSLQELHITRCNLISIQNGAFNVKELKNMHTLRFINNAIVTLTTSVFNGLMQLKHFEFSQYVQSGKEIGNNFLTPFAVTLTSVKIMQVLDNNAIVDPNAWLQDASFVALYIVDLSNNNLRDKLNPDTFRNLPAVGNISLINCALDTIGLKPFESLFKTLHYLYLDNNNLITLDANFLDTLELNHVILSAKENNWQCICDHSDMWDYMRFEHENEYINKVDFICSGPPDVKGQYMKDLIMRCDEEKTTTTTKEDETTDTTRPTITDEVSTVIKPRSTTTTISSTRTTTTRLWTTSSEPTDPTNYERIQCAAQNSSETVTITLLPRTADLTFIPSDTNSIQIISSIDSAGYSIIQFLKYSQFSIIQPISSHEWIVHNFNANYNYMFCLVHGNDTNVSPFDCWGFSINISLIDVWLQKSDKSWFVTLMLIVALFFCALGAGAVYLFLRSRPSWLLKSNERIMRVHESSNKIILLSKKSPMICRRRPLSTSDNLATQQVKRATYLIPQSHSDMNSNVVSSHYISRHKPPTEYAPALPADVKGNSRSNAKSSLRWNDFILSKPVADRQHRWSNYTDGSDYGYNTINDYEEIRY